MTRGFQIASTGFGSATGSALFGAEKSDFGGLEFAGAVATCAVGWLSAWPSLGG